MALGTWSQGFPNLMKCTMSIVVCNVHLWFEVHDAILNHEQSNICHRLVAMTQICHRLVAMVPSLRIWCWSWAGLSSLLGGGSVVWQWKLDKVTFKVSYNCDTVCSLQLFLM